MCHGEVRTRSSERRGVMTVAGTDDIDLSANEFWALPLTERAAAFARLRAEPRPRFFAEPEVPFSDQGPGYYALVRYADVVEASKYPAVFSSAQGATSIPDLPVEFNEYFGSMINMDDPRHARLRRIVSRAFSPRLIAKFEDDVRRAAIYGRRRPAGHRAVRLRGERRRPAAAEDHLRHDGHSGRPVRHGPGQHQHHLVRSRPGVPVRGHGPGGAPAARRRAGARRPGHRRWPPSAPRHPARTWSPRW